MTAARQQGAVDAMLTATPLTRQVTLCLDGALQGEYDELSKQLVEVSLGINQEDSLAPTGQDAADALAKQIDRVHNKMAASVVVFSFVAMPWLGNLGLRAEHPPRDGNLLDNSLGYNVETYTPALLKTSCRSVMGADKKIVADVPDEAWDAMLGNLNGEQYEILRQAALNANERATTVPPSARSLLGTQVSGASSKSRRPGTSRPRGSKGGSRSGSPRSAATKKAASSG